jgi:hypothetical protein
MMGGAPAGPPLPNGAQPGISFLVPGLRLPRSLWGLVPLVGWVVVLVALAAVIGPAVVRVSHGRRRGAQSSSGLLGRVMVRVLMLVARGRRAGR